MRKTLRRASAMMCFILLMTLSVRYAVPQTTDVAESAELHSGPNQSPECEALLAFWDDSATDKLPQWVFFSSRGQVHTGDYVAVENVEADDTTLSYSTYLAWTRDGTVVKITSNGGCDTIAIPQGYHCIGMLSADYVCIAQDDGAESADTSIRILNCAIHAIIPGRWDTVGGYGDGLFLVGVGDRLGFIDGDGVIRIPCEYVYAHPFRSGVTVAASADGRRGIIDTKGKFVVQFGTDERPGSLLPSGDHIGGVRWLFQNDRCAAYLMDTAPVRYILIDTSGRRVSSVEFCGPEPFSDGLMCAYDPECRVFGYLDSSGHWAIGPRFAEAESFHAGRAAVRLTTEDPWRWIDTTGNVTVVSRAPRDTLWYNSELGYSPTTKQCYTVDGDAIGSPFTSPAHIEGIRLPFGNVYPPGFIEWRKRHFAGYHSPFDQEAEGAGGAED